MTTAETEIQVFAKFPDDPGSSESPWNWVHCLTFPTYKLRECQFSPRPFKWIRFAIGVVIGARGDLSHSDNDPLQLVDYDCPDLPSESIVLYYHTSDVERRHTFPIDPDMPRTHVTSDVGTSQREYFRDDVKQRDGSRCVLVRDIPEELCDVAHLLPHGKGDAYIKTYTRHRSRGAQNDIVHGIDNIWNTIFLNKSTHEYFSTDVAFLMTPNFAMTTADIITTASPTERRCTAHRFVPEPYCFGNPTLPQGSPVRIPDIVDDWPPDILFDAVYASAVLQHFAPQPALDSFHKWKPFFYPGGITNKAQASYQKIPDGRADEEVTRAERADSRAARRKNRDQELDNFDILLMMPYILMPPDKLEASWREAADREAKRERSHLEDRVMEWQSGVVNVHE